MLAADSAAELVGHFQSGTGAFDDLLALHYSEAGQVAATAVLEFVRPSMEFRMNTFLRAQLLPLLRGLSRAGLVGFGVVFTLYFLFAMLLFVLNDPHASAYTEQMADMSAPWLVGLVAVYALSKLAGEMVRTWLEDRGEISPRR